jgi:hypothetical protein
MGTAVRIGVLNQNLSDYSPLSASANSANVLTSATVPTIIASASTASITTFVTGFSRVASCFWVPQDRRDRCDGDHDLSS